jgi:hypothetical protein
VGNSDMHDDERSHVAAADRLPEGTFVRGVVICHHTFGMGIELDDGGQCGHVDLPMVRDTPRPGETGFPPIGTAISAVVLGYSGHGQLRLTTRLHDMPGYR